MMLRRSELLAIAREVQNAGGMVSSWGFQSSAARELRVHRSTIHRDMRALLRVESFGQG